MAIPVIGIIGLGYLGQEIVRLAQWPHSSWGTNLHKVDADDDLDRITFNWGDEKDWTRLPDLTGTLIITAPPVLKSSDAEIQRLRTWGSWMNQSRPGYRSLVYISTTGVYPNRDGTWQEEDELQPDSSKARLRVATERTLGDNFSLRVIRAGAIYGPKRNIGERILAGKPIPSGNQPVHRIHVHDLARIVQLAVTQPEFPPIVNAVDQNPVPTRQAAEWLMNQSLPRFKPELRLNLNDELPTRKKTSPAPNRLISNRLLTETCGFQFVFPGYREGLLHELQ